MPSHCVRCDGCCSAMGDVRVLGGDLRSGRCTAVDRYPDERTGVTVDPG